MKPSIPFYRVAPRPNLYVHHIEPWEAVQREAEQAHDQRLYHQELAVEIVVVLLLVAGMCWVIVGLA